MVQYSDGPVHIWATLGIRSTYRGSDEARVRDWDRDRDSGKDMFRGRARVGHKTFWSMLIIH